MQGSRASSSSSWAAVEEKMAMEFAIWKSRNQPHQEENMELMAGARMKVTDRGLATITIGKLEWELAPPSGYPGYCEKLQERDDWLLVSRSGFRVTLHASQGSLQLCPCNGDLESALAGVSLTDGIVSRFFTSGDLSPSPKLRRSLSQTKREELIELRLSAPFQKCVNGLRNAIDLPDVFDTILGFSAVYIANEHVLQQVSESEDDNDYFYDLEGMEELRAFEMERRNGATWVRNQVREASLQCQAAAEATSEAAKVVVNMLLNKLEPIGEEADEDEDKDDDEEEAHDPMEISRNQSSSGLHIEGATLSTNLIVFDDDPQAESPPVVDNDEFDDGEESRVDGRSTSSGITRQSDYVFMDTVSSTSSWEYVRAPKSCGNVASEPEEDDILGPGISDAESLAMMLRSRDPFGCNDCSHLVNEFLTLSLGSSSTHQDPNGDENKLKKSTVLKRLASWSSSNSGWSTASTDRDSLSYVSKLRLKALEEEPLCEPDPETANACRSFVNRAAVMGDVLQWCSCRFNKSRSSIEMTFHVRCFMDDDIATLSTGISNASPLHIEIFLDTINMRQSLLEGRVRVAAYQEFSDEECAQPVTGLSCYVPHVVREYLQQSIHEQVDVPDGQLLTGLMKHVVAKLVFLKQSCCVCNSPRLQDMVTSMVPKPCDENLCQALHDLWLVVAPPMVLERSTIERWLRACVFHEGVDVDESLMVQFMQDPRDMLYDKHMTYERRLEKVMLWVDVNVVEGSWLKLVKENNPMRSHELRFREDLSAFPNRNDECTDSFAIVLKAWQSRYLNAMRPPAQNDMRRPAQKKTPVSRLGNYLL